MVRRANAIYRALAWVFLFVAILVILFSSGLDAPVHIAVVITGIFLLVIAFSYFNLSERENKGSA